MNAGSGNNIFHFFFDSGNTLTETVEVTISTDGENNVPEQAPPEATEMTPVPTDEPPVESTPTLESTQER